MAVDIQGATQTVPFTPALKDGMLRVMALGPGGATTLYAAAGFEAVLRMEWLAQGAEGPTGIVSAWEAVKEHTAHA